MHYNAYMVHCQRIGRPNPCYYCGLLADSIDYIIPQRKVYLKNKLKRKYKKILSMPYWEDSEFNGMSNQLRHFILKSLEEKRLTEERIRY